jgi:cellulose synthase operon protein C
MRMSGCYLFAASIGLLAAGRVLAQDRQPDEGLRRPRQLTTGSADEFLGDLSPDGKTLYFVSNRSATNEIYAQDIDDGRARRLFDDGADATWPRVSPDGRWLLYVSFRDDASGRLCVRDLPRAERRLCFEGSSSATQAEWIDPSHIALVSRSSLQGDLRLIEVTLVSSLEGRTLLDRNLTSPAISPGGRWLVYVPVEREVSQVGPTFAAKAARRFEAVRLDRLSDKPITFEIDLPGMAAQPAFSRDGKHLYFVQFLSDTNHDGVVDATDHGVLFRVPFPVDQEDAPSVAAAAMPEQLTDGSWNCQYPSPSAGTLITTCSQGEDLDVYELPLNGEVPSEWNSDRVHLEIELGGRRSEQLLLYRRLLREEGSIAGRRLRLARLVRLHVQFDDFDAAEFYARHIEALKDPSTAGLSRVLQAWIAHRKALRDLELGRAVAGFSTESKRRMDSLRAAEAKSPTANSLAHLVLSDIADSIGEKAEARKEFELAEIDDRTRRSVVEMYYERADALFRELDDRDALVAVCRGLASLGSLPPDVQLEYARAEVRALYRGRPFDEAERLLDQERAAATEGSERAFALEVGRAVVSIRDADATQARSALLTLYKKQTRPDRQRAIMLDALQRAAEFGADKLVEALVQDYVEDVKPGTTERRRAEQLYQQVILGRAFRHRAQGRVEKARADFDAVVAETRSLEALVASLDLRLKAGQSRTALLAEFGSASGKYPKTLERFARSYLVARGLPELSGQAHAEGVAEALGELRSDWTNLKGEPMARALFGAILHEDFLRTGDLATAERASSHYFVALRQVGNHPREQAMLLGQLGLLQAGVGNYRIALGYLDDREKLPYEENGEGLAVRLTRARTLLHVGRDKEAASVAEEALAMIEQTPRLSNYRPFVVDRAALYNLAAGHFDRAEKLYDEDIAFVEKQPAALSLRNRLVLHLARAAAALGAGNAQRTLDDLAVVKTRLDDPQAAEALKWPHSTSEQVLRGYRLIAAGLGANAFRRLGKLDAAARELEKRRNLFEERLSEGDRDEELRAVALAEFRLADNAVDRGDLPTAARWIGKALEHADTLASRTGTPVDRGQLDALWFSAELSVFREASLPFDLPKRLDEAYGKMVQTSDVVWRSDERTFEIYQALLRPAR